MKPTRTPCPTGTRWLHGQVKPRVGFNRFAVSSPLSFIHAGCHVLESGLAEHALTAVAVAIPAAAAKVAGWDDIALLLSSKPFIGDVWDIGTCSPHLLLDTDRPAFPEPEVPNM